MKIRSGFVSNSSSSSFCIYGTFIGRGELDLAAIKAHKDKPDEEELEEDEEEYDDDDDYEFWENRASELGLEQHSFDGCDGHYLGISWSSIGDNETGKEFKERVEKLVAQFCGKQEPCETYEEAFYS
jgi:hypothetical protein